MADVTSQHTIAEIDKAISAVISDAAGANPATSDNTFAAAATIPYWESGPKFGTVAGLFASPQSIGATTPAAGAFTTLSATVLSNTAFTVTGTSAAGAVNSQFANDTGNKFGIYVYGSTYSGGSLLSVGASGVALTAGTSPISINAADIRFGIGSAEKGRFDTSGNFLLGATATSSNAQLYATKTYSAASGTDVGAQFTYVQSALSTGALRGVSLSLSASHTSGTLAGLIGVYSSVAASGAGGTTTSAFGLRTTISASNATAIITNAYGLYIDAFTATGTITNRWAIYSAETGASYLAGALRIGVTTATTVGTEILRVSGTVTEAINVHNTSGNDVRIWFTNSDTGTSYTDGFSVGISSDETAIINNRESTAMRFFTAASERMRIDAAKNVLYIGDDANANMTAGLTLQQSTADDEIFACKSADVAHAYVAQAETDTYFAIRKSASTGGVAMRAIANDSAAISQVLEFDVYGGQASATKSTSGAGLVNFYVAEHDGANAIADITADGNVFSVTARSGGAWKTRFILDEDGDLWITGNMNIGGAGVVTAGLGCLAIANATAPSAVAADSLAIYSLDLSAGNTIPGIWTEGTAIYASGTPAAATGSIAMSVNGTVYHFTVSTTAAS